jgi:hypothetical protein
MPSILNRFKAASEHARLRSTTQAADFSRLRQALRNRMAEGDIDWDWAKEHMTGLLIAGNGPALEVWLVETIGGHPGERMPDRHFQPWLGELQIKALTQRDSSVCLAMHDAFGPDWAKSAGRWLLARHGHDPDLLKTIAEGERFAARALAEREGAAIRSVIDAKAPGQSGEPRATLADSDVVQPARRGARL